MESAVRMLSCRSWSLSVFDSCPFRGFTGDDFVFCLFVEEVFGSRSCNGL
jgi:hypothetical protein